MDDAVEEVEEEEVEVEEVEEGMQLHLSGLNKTGYKGVTHLLKMKKFRAMETGPQGKPLGYFDTAVEAAVRYARHIQSQEGSASPTASSAGVLDCAASSMSSSMSGSEPAVESGSPGGQFPLALLPAAGGGDEHDDEVEGASTQTCKICGRGASLVNTQTCNRALPPCPYPFPLLLLTRGFAFGAALIHCRGCNQARHTQCGEPLKCLAINCRSEQHVQCREREWRCAACKRSRPGAKTGSREEARKQQEEKQEAKKQLA